MKLSCSVIRDLLPLYAEGMTGAESNALVQEHLQRIENSMRELGIHNADFSSLVSIETIEKQAQE